MRPVLKNGLAALQVDLNEVHVELFASKEQHMMQLYCSRYLNNAYRFDWKLMGLCYANLPFSQLAKVLPKTALEGGRVVLCTPDWHSTGERAYWRRLLDRMTVGRTELPNAPIYVPEDPQETMPAPEWGSFLSIIDGSLNPVPVSDLDQVVLKELMAENRGLTLLNLKITSQYSSVTTTSGECSDVQETPPVSTPLADADDRLSDIASVIPPVDPEMVTLKHSAFLAQLLWMRWTFGSPLMAGPMTTPYSPCRPQMALQVRYLAPNPHPTICQSPGLMYRTSNRLYGLRLRVSSDRAAWTSSRRPGKRLYGPGRMMKRLLFPIPRYLWHTTFS